MPIEKFEIQLDNPYRSYFAGDIITGEVVLVLRKPKLIHGVKLKLVGKAETQFDVGSGRAKTYHSQREVYIDEKIYLAGYETETSEMTLESGSYTYPFNFFLPSSLPSSYTHKYGKVKYTLEATISRVGFHLHPICKTTFSLIGILDLNLELEARRSLEISDENVLCCLCCTSGPVGFDLKLFKTGYVPGERIGFHVHMYNHSNRPVNWTFISLIQELTFRADSKTKTQFLKMGREKGPKLRGRETTDWITTSDSSPLIVPSLPPSRLDGCGIIHISYYLQFKMAPRDAVAFKKRLPIIIGSIPVRNELRGDRPISTQPTSLSRQQSSFFFDFAPPTYEEATKGEMASSPENDSDCFIPKYANYTFTQE